MVIINTIELNAKDIYYLEHKIEKLTLICFSFGIILQDQAGQSCACKCHSISTITPTRALQKEKEKGGGGQSIHERLILLRSVKWLINRLYYLK